MAKKIPPLKPYSPDLGNAKAREQTPHERVDALGSELKNEITKAEKAAISKFCNDCFYTNAHDLLEKALSGDKRAIRRGLDLLAHGDSFYAPILEGLNNGLESGDLTLTQAFSPNTNDKGRDKKNTISKPEAIANYAHKLKDEKYKPHAILQAVRKKFPKKNGQLCQKTIDNYMSKYKPPHQ